MKKRYYKVVCKKSTYFTHIPDFIAGEWYWMEEIMYDDSYTSYRVESPDGCIYVSHIHLSDPASLFQEHMDRRLKTINMIRRLKTTF
jgi:hypothetical protein